jgi:HTH-type transcriptional regulator / antitoxin HipB
MPIDTPTAFGQALRTARKQLGLTQTQLAQAAGVGLRFIVDLEAGKPTAQLGKTLQVLRCMGGSLQLGGLPGQPSNPQPPFMP